MRRKFHAKNSICTLAVCSYVASMKWEQILLVVIIVAGAAALVWRSSGKKHQPGCGCGCGCGHDADAGPEKDQQGGPDKPSRPTP
jgi:hypothetical protein